MTAITKPKLMGIKTRLRLIGNGFLTFWAGFLCCWSPLTAPLLAGWLNQYMLRSAVRMWIRRSTLEDKDSIYQTPGLENLKVWPRWSETPENRSKNIINQASRSIRAYGKIKRFLKSICSHYRSGFLSLFNTWLMTLPFLLIWLWMWWAGWNVAFARGYEEDGAAAAISLLSVLVFSLIMFYLPIAQTRQAIHGTWKSFFEFRPVRAIARKVRLRIFFLAILYALGSFGIVAGTKVFPVFFEQAYGIDLADAKTVKDRIFIHFFFVILCFYAGLLVVKRMNAQVYAIGVLKALQSRTISPDDLAPIEHDLLLNRLRFKEPELQKPSNLWKRALIWPLKTACLTTVLAATLAIWGSVAFSVYFGQFMNHSYPDWLNLPLIQMPYIRVPEINPG